MELARRHRALVSGLLLTGCTKDFTGNGALAATVAEGYWEKMKQQRHVSSDAAEQARRDALFEECIARHGITPDNMAACFVDWGEHCAEYLEGVRHVRGQFVEVYVPEAEIHGPLHNLDNATKLAERCLGVRGHVEVVPNVGHLWNLDAPNLFSETVRALARKIAQFQAAQRECMQLEQLEADRREGRTPRMFADEIPLAAVDEVPQEIEDLLNSSGLADLVGWARDQQLTLPALANQLHELGRTAFLQKLKSTGVAKLADRQKLSNVIGKVSKSLGL